MRTKQIVRYCQFGVNKHDQVSPYKLFVEVAVLMMCVIMFQGCKTGKTLLDKPALPYGYAPDKPMPDRVGICHINSNYHLTDNDFMNEGADKILELGGRSIKLIIRDQLDRYYAFNSPGWPAKITSLIQAAETDYFQDVLSKPFSTYVLMAYTPYVEDIHYFTKDFTEADHKRESDSFYEFSKYLLTKFSGTGKTFILQNWEGDWVLTPPDTYMEKQAEPRAVQGMINWLNARQEGVDRARKEVGMHGVRVVHAAEVNLLDIAMEGKPCVTNSVLPYTHCDLYSYSAWNTIVSPPEVFRKSLEYLKKMAPDSKLYGADNIYVGEYGWSEREPFGGSEHRMNLIHNTMTAALDFGAQYVMIWELYCDGLLNESAKDKPKNDDVVGNWIIRPDGSKSDLWYYLLGMYDAGNAR